MSVATKLLLVLAVAVVAAGLVYVGRPEPEVDLSVSVPPSPSISPHDNTMAWPPASPTPPSIEPISETVSATIVTSRGEIGVELIGQAAPLTVGNFISLAQQNFYDGTTFHRVIEDFMIQGGDPFSKDPGMQARVGTGDPGYRFADEINDRPLVRGSVAMANSGPDTNGSQFFIVTATATPHLDGLHTNFGHVTRGMEVVDAISQVATDEGGAPLEPIVVEDIVLDTIPAPPLQPLE